MPSIDLPFSVAEYKARLARIEQEMDRRNVDVLMINHLENIYYLSDFARSATTRSWRCSWSAAATRSI